MATAEQTFLSHLREAEQIRPTAPTEGSRAAEALAKEDPDISSPVTLRNLFTHHDAHPVALDLACMRAFGAEWYRWEAATLWTEIKRTFQSEVSESVRHKLQAVRTLKVSELPWTSWNVFEKVAHSLNGTLPDWSFMQAVGLEELYAAVDMIDQIHRGEWADEVKRYMAACVLHDDVFFVPAPLQFVQAEVAQPYYICQDCGNANPALFHDGFCDSCTRRFEGGNLSFAPDPEAVAAGRGKRLTIHLRYDPEPVERRWGEVAKLPSRQVRLEETPEDVQVDKLLAARDYMNIRRKQLIEQITALKGWLGAV